MNPTWTPTPGDHVIFRRGMFGLWRGRIVRTRLYRSRLGSRRTEMVADVGYTRSNGTRGRHVVALADLLPVPYTR